MNTLHLVYEQIKRFFKEGSIISYNIGKRKLHAQSTLKIASMNISDPRNQLLILLETNGNSLQVRLN